MKWFELSRRVSQDLHRAVVGAVVFWRVCGCDFVVVFLWWCGCVFAFCGGVFFVVVWLCFCGGVAVFFCDGVCVDLLNRSKTCIIFDADMVDLRVFMELWIYLLMCVYVPIYVFMYLFIH